uniref:hypothetical protein n=1 Tax=Pedobacter schmidteae TaxID=2201271 RepID=UPI0013CE7B2A|nr:hypothetical protein [Pedobacter schmidteae]
MKKLTLSLFSLSLISILTLSSFTYTLSNKNASAKVLQGGGPLDDDDKDGVINKNDKCPNTPLGQTVDANGCPIWVF